MDNGDLIIRSDLDSRGFFMGDEDLDLALTGCVGSVRLLETAGVIGTARLSTSGRALNMLIDQQLHTVPLRSLTPVITGYVTDVERFRPSYGGLHSAGT